MIGRRALPALLLPGLAAAQARPLGVASFSILGDLLREVAQDGEGGDAERPRLRRGEPRQEQGGEGAASDHVTL